MIDTSPLSGVVAPILTPFDDDLAPSSALFTDHARRLLNNGCTGLAPFGTTGEALSLGVSERLRLLDALLDSGIEASALLPGTGLCALSDTVTLTRHAVDLGCRGVLMLPPFFYKGEIDEGLYRFFAEVIERSGDSRLRIYLYHIPPVAGVGFSMKLIERLLINYPGCVVGFKDSSGLWSHTQALLKAFPQLTVFVGSEVFLLQSMREGGAGCITATANINAAPIRRLYDHWQTEGAVALQESLTAARTAIQSQHSMIAILKALVAAQQNEARWHNVRPPLVPLAPSQSTSIIEALQRIQDADTTWSQVHGNGPSP